MCGERRTQQKISEFTDGIRTHDRPYTSKMKTDSLKYSAILKHNLPFNNLYL